MLDDFDPQEKKVIVIFLALLVLGLVYVGKNGLPFEQPYELQSTPLPSSNNNLPANEEQASSSGRFL